MATWTSDVYAHFRMPPIISVRKGIVIYTYTCIAYVVYMFLGPPTNFVTYSHPSITISRARHDESTGNLKRHVTNCLPANSSQTQAIAAYASGSTYTAASHRMKIALWVSKNNRPFSIVEDEELLDIFTDLNPNCITSSGQTVSRDVKEIFYISRNEVGALLRVSSCILPINEILTLVLL